MATIICTSGNQTSGLGFLDLLERLEQRGHDVIVVDAEEAEGLRNPLVVGVLREHALTDKNEDIFFLGGPGDSAVRTAAEYLWKHGEPCVSGVILISPPVPLLVAPFRNILSVGKTFLEKIVVGNSLLEEIKGLVDRPLVLRTCLYPALHFYSISEEGVQKILGRKLLAMSFASSHPVRCDDTMILDSEECEVVIERIENWIDAIMLANRPLGTKQGLATEVS